MEELLHGDDRWLADRRRRCRRHGAVGWRHHQRRGRISNSKPSTTGWSRRACRAAWSPTTSPIRSPESRRRCSIWPGRTASGGAEPAGRGTAERGRSDDHSRQPGRLPLLHGCEVVQALRRSRSAGGRRPCLSNPAPSARRRTASSRCSPTRRGPTTSATATSASGTSARTTAPSRRRSCATT